MKYEIMFIIRPDIDEEKLKEEIKKLEKILIDNKAKIVTSKEFGQKNLAYEIKGHKAGYYFLYEISCKDDKAQKEFDRLATLNENIIRHLIINLEK